MARPGSSGGRLSAALADDPAPPEPMPPESMPPEPMPPGGAWPAALYAVPAGIDPPTVPLPPAGAAAGPPDRGDRSAGQARPPRTARAARDSGQGGRPAAAGDRAVRGPGGASRRGVAGFARLVRAAVPPSWGGARVRPDRPGATALALVAALAAVLAAVGVWWGRPQAEPVGLTGALPALVVTAAPGTDAPAPETVPASTGPLVLSVSGRVARPGLIELPDGARVADALEAAGGALPGTDLSTLNLARRVVDGEQIAVGVPPAPDVVGAPAAAGGGQAATAGGGPVDLNTATESQLDALPGVGPVTASRILEWRRIHGRFARVEQLREIEGIGERRFAQLRELVVV